MRKILDKLKLLEPKKYRKMNTELIFASIIIGYLLAVFSAVVVEYEIERQDYVAEPFQMVELFGNGTVRNYEIENTFEPNLFTSIAQTLSRISFALPFVLGGLGLWNIPLSMYYGSFTMPPDPLNQVLIFLIVSIVSIPVTILLSKGIPMWRRIPYIYLIAALISGTPILFSSNFGG